MRRILVSLALGLFGVTGCGVEGGSLFADIQYATDCQDTGGCTAARRDVCGIDQGDACEGVPGVASLTCSVVEASDGSTRLLNLSATQGSDFSLRIGQALFDIGGGAARGASCTVTVVDGANTFTGACGSAAPNDTQPCQLDNVVFEEDVEGIPTITGHLFCIGLQHSSNPSLSIEFHQTGFAAADAIAPGTFRIQNCDGLNL